MSASQEPYRDAVAVGGELGTSTSKFCADDQVVVFSSVVGDALTPTLEDNWRRMWDPLESTCRHASLSIL